MRGGSTEGLIEVSLDVSGEITLGNEIAAYKSSAYRALMSDDYATALANFRQALKPQQPGRGSHELDGCYLPVHGRVREFA